MKRKPPTIPGVIAYTLVWIGLTWFATVGFQTGCEQEYQHKYYGCVEGFNDQKRTIAELDAEINDHYYRNHRLEVRLNRCKHSLVDSDKWLLDCSKRRLGDE